jgi:hypothetical protein
MESFVFWLDRPFHPRRPSKEKRRRAGYVTIRYSGSFGRSAIKALVVLALLAVLTSVIGDRAGQDLDAHEVASSAGAAAAHQ